MQYLAFDCNERKVLHESTREVDGETEIFKCDPFTESYRTAEIAPNDMQKSDHPVRTKKHQMWKVWTVVIPAMLRRKDSKTPYVDKNKNKYKKKSEMFFFLVSMLMEVIEEQEANHLAGTWRFQSMQCCTWGRRVSI